MKVLNIGMVASLTGCCVDTIRNLEKKGIIIPARDSSGRRIYSVEDVEYIVAYRKKRGLKNESHLP